MPHIAPWLDGLCAALNATRVDAGDAAAVHDLRVATRRLDTWLRLADRRTLRDDLRWLRHAAGPARDLDVVAARPWPPAVASALAERRMAAQRELARAVGSPRAVAIVAALRPSPPLHRRTVEAVLTRMVARLRAERVDPGVVDAVHARRRRLRRVRYAAELIGRPTTALVRLQDALGALSDVNLLQRTLPAEVTPDALRRALADADAAWTRYAPCLEDLR